MIEWLLEPLQYAFITRALLAAVTVGIVCPVVGCYVVLRGMAFFGDALAHIILPGVVLAFLWGWPLSLGALIVGVVAAVGIGALTERRYLKEDTAIGVIFAGFFALGVALLSRTGNYTIDLAHFLFGNLLGVQVDDLVSIMGLTAVALLTVILFFKEFMVISFDPTLAVTLRLPTRFLRYLLLILIAITIVVSLQVVGIALMLAMLVTPAAAASLLTNRLTTMMGIAAGIGAISGIVGVYTSYYLDIASGPAVVLVATLVFVLVFLFSPRRGIVWDNVLIFL